MGLVVSILSNQSGMMDTVIIETYSEQPIIIPRKDTIRNFISERLDGGELLSFYTVTRGVGSSPEVERP